MLANAGSQIDRIRGLPVSEALETPIDSRASAGPLLGRYFDGETTAYATLTFGDLLYDRVRIEPHVVEAFHFFRAGDVADVLSFASSARGIQSLDQSARVGCVSQLQGYVAEHVAAGILRAQGAEVAFADDARQPGYDLIVNGDPFQVKCLSDPAAVYTHWSKYPDIQILLNEELAAEFADDCRVTVLPGLNREQIAGVTESSLEGGAGLFELQAPLFSTALQAARNVLAVAKRRTVWRAAAENLGIDSIIRMIGSKGGAVGVASGLGLLGIGGGWMVVVAPIVGASAGHKAAACLADRAKLALFCQYEAAELVQALGDYGAAAILQICRMIERADRQARRLDKLSKLATPVGLELLRQWQERIEEENAFRRQMIREFQHCASRLDRPRAGSELLSMSGRLCVIAAQVGLLPSNLAPQNRRLLSASEALRKAMHERLLPA